MDEADKVPRAQSYLEEYRHQQQLPDALPVSLVSHVWSRSPLGRVKLNTDAGIDDEGVGLGVVVRNHDGNFILAAAKRLKGINDPTLGEALAIEFGFQLARHHHLTMSVVETDCLVVVNKLEVADEIQTEIGVVLRNIRRLAAMMGGSVHFASRVANEAAHIMAHTKARWDITGVWFDRPLLNLLDQLLKDNVASFSTGL
ncbi:unnamed protein product [Linum trigynum]|uniref:RNase H type-1 domain-containing protein n=1 Tax=Linum trigynum TaxID=586398 RepID=A0AAV2F5R7_9ROSI